MSEGQELRFEADGLTYAALAWGNPGAPVILALHGWLDNARSFIRLAPLLHHYRVVAVDLSGHGYSDHRSADATYNIWDDLPQLVSIVDQLTSGNVHLMGHSRGATIAALLAAVLQDRCEHLVMIDGLIPAFMDDRDAGHQLRNFVLERDKYRARPTRYFASVEEFADRRKQYGFASSNGHDLAPRALELTEQGYRLLCDPRLYGTSATWLDREKRLQIYRSIKAPVLSVMGEDGLFARQEVARQLIEDAGSAIADFRSTTIAGSHHLHMEEASVSQVAHRIEHFLGTGQ